MEPTVFNDNVDYELSIANESYTNIWGYFKYATGEEILETLEEGLTEVQEELSKGNKIYSTDATKNDNGDIVVNVKIGITEFPIQLNDRYNLKELYNLLQKISREFFLQLEANQKQSVPLINLKIHLLIGKLLYPILNNYKYKTKDTVIFLKQNIPNFSLLNLLLLELPYKGVEPLIDLTINKITLDLLRECLKELNYTLTTKTKVLETVEDEFESILTVKIIEAKLI